MQEEPKFFIAVGVLNYNVAYILGVFDTFEKAKACVIADRDADYPELTGMDPEWSTSAYWYTNTWADEEGTGWEIDAYEMNVKGRWYGDSSK